MTAYVALLRGVNVGKANKVPMDALRADCAALGFRDISTYLVSGNVVFNAKAASADTVRSGLERKLARYMSTDPCVMVRDAAQMARLVKAAPFPAAARDLSHNFVTFLERSPAPSAALPPSVPQIEYLALKGTEAFSVGRLVRGRLGYPGPALEKALGVRGTTRNIAVVQELSRRLAALGA